MKKLAIITLFTLAPALLRAQAPAWPDSSGSTSSGCYRLAIPPISTVPPFRMDMNWQTMLGYVWFDTMMRHAFTDSEWAAMDSMQSQDTLQQILKYWYAVSDYDPILFQEYCSDGQYLNSHYWGKPASFVRYLQDKTGKIMGDSSGVPYLITTNFILDINVATVTADSDTSMHFGHSLPFPLGCVEAFILDTIKGKHIPTRGCSNIGFSYNSTKQKGYSVYEKHNVHTLAETSPCFHFSFSPVWPKGGGDLIAGHAMSHSSGVDSIVYDKNAFGWNSLIPGQRYIVFLASVYEDYDGTNSYFGIRPIMDGVGGVYPVIAGNVQDPSNYWKMGTSVNLATFKAGLRQRIWNIEHP